MSREQQAYVPYLYARDCISQITDDMKFMKEKHIRIVHDIEAHYRSLEGESQVLLPMSCNMFSFKYLNTYVLVLFNSYIFTPS